MGKAMGQMEELKHMQLEIDNTFGSDKVEEVGKLTDEAQTWSSSLIQILQAKLKKVVVRDSFFPLSPFVSCPCQAACAAAPCLTLCIARSLGRKKKILTPRRRSPASGKSSERPKMSESACSPMAASF